MGAAGCRIAAATVFAQCAGCVATGIRGNAAEFAPFVEYNALTSIDSSTAAAIHSNPSQNNPNEANQVAVTPNERVQRLA